MYQFNVIALTDCSINVRQDEIRSQEEKRTIQHQHQSSEVSNLRQMNFVKTMTLLTQPHLENIQNNYVTQSNCFAQCQLQYIYTASFSCRVYGWPHSDDADIPEFSETDYQVVRHAFLKVRSMFHCCYNELYNERKFNNQSQKSCYYQH